MPSMSASNIADIQAVVYQWGPKETRGGRREAFPGGSFAWEGERMTVGK